MEHQEQKNNEMLGNNINMVGIIFTTFPYVTTMAIRQNDRAYSIIQRGESFSSNQSISDLYQDLYQTLFTLPQSNIFESEELQSFINHTLQEYKSSVSPLPLDVLNRLPTREVDSPDLCEEKCLICLENFEIGETIMTLPCKHTSHSACIRRWFEEKNTCPQCRQIPH